MRNFKIPRNPYIFFSPFLVLFLIYVLMFPSKGDTGDEFRYMMFAHNITNGFYSPPYPDVNLTNGPGYPLILAPFIAMGFPMIWLTIMNAIFYYLSIVFLYKSLRMIVSYNATLIFSLFWACYYIAYQNIPFIVTETFTYFLVAAMIYCILRVFRTDDRKLLRKYIILSGFLIGYIVMTKIAFGWVSLFMLGGTGLLWLFNRKAINNRKGALIMVVAFATILPYLIYTYQLTGRMFYWSTNSGGSLYWASSPYKDEYGDWKLDLQQHGVDMGNYNTEGSTDSLVAHHGEEYKEIYKHNSMGQDDAYKRFAIKNIKEHPGKYILNCIYNVGRMFFHYPFSHAVQRPKTLAVFPINGILLTFILFCMIPTLLNWRKLSYPVRFMILFAGLYFAESTLVTALIRMFTVIVPIIMLWMAYVFDKTIRINFRFRTTNISEETTGAGNK